MKTITFKNGKTAEVNEEFLEQLLQSMERTGNPNSVNQFQVFKNAQVETICVINVSEISHIL